MKKYKLPLILILSSCCLASCSLSEILDGLFTNSGTSTSKSSTPAVVKGLALYRTDTDEILKSGDTLEIETYYDFYFTLKYNGEEVRAKSITSSDESVVFPHSKSVYPRKEGNAAVTITYLEANGNETTYTINLTSVHRSALQSIYVGNAERGIKLVSASEAKITGKVFAKLQNGMIKVINNDDHLATAIEDGKDANHKKVTLTYTSGTQTASASYEVPLTNNTNEIERTTLGQGFQTYYDNGMYRNYPKLASTGNTNILVIPVWFTDSNQYFNTTVVDHNGKTQKEQVIEDLNASLFGDPLRRNEQTLKSYYYQESFGQLNITGKVSEWYSSSYSSSTNYFSDSTARNSKTLMTGISPQQVNHKRIMT